MKKKEEFQFGKINPPKSQTKKQTTIETKQTLGEKIMKRFDFKTSGGWIAAILLFGAIIFLGFMFKSQMDNMAENQRQMVEYNEMMGMFFIDWQEKIAEQNSNEHIKSAYIAYGADIIFRHYQRQRVAEHRRMTPREINDLLETIYYYAKSNAFPQSAYPDGLFLPLAYAAIESDFIPVAIGADGERSIFQFMEATAREVYRRNGKPFVPNFWQCPKESTWLWFHYYRQIADNFRHDDKEREIRFSALAYNAGTYRNQLIPYFNRNLSIETYLSHFPLRRGIATYNKMIYDTYRQYRDNFRPLN